MCTYITQKTTVSGSGKGANGWFALTHALAYVDHPFHSTDEHTVNVDFLSDRDGPDARVAVELRPESARALVRAIEAALEDATGVI